MIGSCDNCGRDDVPVFNGTACGCETTQCYACNGDMADPYGELDDLQKITGLADAGIRHAEGITAQLAKPTWIPERHHIEMARNSIKKLADSLRTLSDMTKDRNF